MATAYHLVNPVSPYVPLPYGLTSVVNWQTSTDRWEGGIQWESVCATGSTTISPCITGAPILDPPAKAETWDRIVRGARPFTVFSEIDCAAPGWWQLAQEHAARGFTQSEAFQIERVFQTGQVPGMGSGPLIFPNLTSTGPFTDTAALPSVLLQPSSIVVSGSGLDVVEGLGILEKAVASCYQGGTAVIHVPVRLAGAFQAQYLIKQQGPNLTTAAGNKMVIGSGYDETFGPGGTTPVAGSGWIFATGPMFGWRSNIRQLGAQRDQFDRAENTLKMITERTVILGWDCCLAAVLVTLGGEPAGVTGSAA